ncbi:hypothetical protein CJP74_02560 [Psittacicella melopsittaci]|uniref:Uncharacterized protein n=1 Tax=Psittacicella melopsittaci TaxID=2028576 RepID=A0A3A1YAK7_9GAMM|nr:hypothetical protein CJP74_02560 [Psittacicella melopsittaci]
MTKQIIQGTLPSFTGYSGPWVIEKVKEVFVKSTQGQVLTVPKANTILAPIYISVPIIRRYR